MEYVSVMSFPSREERSVCWGARDKYWECLKDNGIKDVKINNEGPCAEFRKVYEKSCSSQWVKHFDRKHSYLQFKEKIEKDGYEKFDKNDEKAS